MASELIKKIKFGVGGYDAIEIHCGDTNPESNISAPYGSIYIYTGSATATIYQKRSDVSLSTGWFNISGNATTTVKGLVNQAVAVPNGSSVDTLLQALRDAGLVAT